MTLDCLKDIIGVTPSDCDCIVGGLDSDTRAKLAISKSGLYLDNLPGGISLQKLKNLDACKDLAAIALQAKQDAIKFVSDNLSIVMSDRIKTNARPYKGYIAKPAYTMNLPGPYAYHGIEIAANHFDDAVLELSKIRMVGALSIYNTVRITRVETGFDTGVDVFVSQGFNTVANNYVEVPMTEPIKLPFLVDGKPQTYYVRSDNYIQPKDTKIGCGCRGSDADLLKTYVKAKGFGANNAGDYVHPAQKDDYSHGFVLDVEIRCNSSVLVCREFDAKQEISVALAYAVWYKAGELLTEAVLASPTINRFTLNDRHYHWGKRDHFRVQSESRISYTGNKIDPSASDCFVCSDQKMRYTGIKS